MDRGPSHITVLMPIRNGQAWIQESMRSILAQEHQDFEILIVDDGSTDDSIPVAFELGKEKVRVVRANGEGLAKALALGVAAAETELIARMDVDDIAHPLRLTRQIDFLNRHPAHVLVGSNVRLINEQGTLVGQSNFPLSDAGIRMRMVLGSPFAHSSVTFKRSAVQEAGSYWSPDSKPFPEDYHLWCRLAQVGLLANVPEYLLDYRVSAKGISQTHRELMQYHRSRISWTWFSQLHPTQASKPGLQDAWSACFSERTRISMRDAAIVTQAIIRARLSTPQELQSRGLLLKHYLYPIRRMIG